MSHFLGRREIAKLIPHGDEMSLLDEVSWWNQSTLCGLSGRHRAGEHPLRSNHHLGGIILIEYAAQAAAVHAILIGGLQDMNNSGSKAAYLGAVKNLKIHCNEFDETMSQLVVTAHSEFQQTSGAIYGFEISANEERLIEGRLVLIQ